MCTHYSRVRQRPPRCSARSLWKASCLSVPTLSEILHSLYLCDHVSMRADSSVVHSMQIGEMTPTDANFVTCFKVRLAFTLTTKRHTIRDRALSLKRPIQNITANVKHRCASRT
jgi:hypothetical protein